MSDLEQRAKEIAGRLSEAQRDCLLAINEGFGVNDLFRLDEGEHHAPYTALVKRGVLEKTPRSGDYHTLYNLTALGHAVRAILTKGSTHDR